MNKIVREHYPVENLPEDLRTGLDPAKQVRVVIEQADEAGISLPTMTELQELRSKFKPAIDDPVERVRKLRDEWDG
jgi:hypothetical protein